MFVFRVLHNFLLQYRWPCSSHRGTPVFIHGRISEVEKAETTIPVMAKDLIGKKIDELENSITNNTKRLLLRRLRKIAMIMASANGNMYGHSIRSAARAPLC
ncbi:MAG: hypothetical protein LBI56_03120 [Puniceicoccales bacterium]|jgi:hypothetical protein|nr:hypothetical protein [Puniceicoccales bacterium]